MRLDEAVELVQRALKIEPDNPSFLDSLGWAYFQQGKLDLADPPLTQAAEQAARRARSCRSTSAICVQAAALRRRGRPLGARARGRRRSPSIAPRSRRRSATRVRASNVDVRRAGAGSPHDRPGRSGPRSASSSPRAAAPRVALPSGAGAPSPDSAPAYAEATCGSVAASKTLSADARPVRHARAGRSFAARIDAGSPRPGRLRLEAFRAPSGEAVLRAGRPTARRDARAHARRPRAARRARRRRSSKRSPASPLGPDECARWSPAAALGERRTG